MFDGLKDKLGSFREDAEEAAEENAEPVDDDDAERLDDAEAERLDGDDSSTAADPEAEPSDSEASEHPDDAATPATTEDEPASDAAAETGDADAEPAGSVSDPETEPNDPAVEPTDTTPETETEAETAPETEPEAAPETEPETDPEVDPTAGVEAPEIIDPSASSDYGSGPDLEDADADADTAAAGTADADAGPATGSDVDADAAQATAEDGEDDVSLTQKARSLTRGKFVIEEEDLEGPLQDLEMALLASDVEMDVASQLLDNIREQLVGETRTFTTGTGEVVEDALRTALLDVVSVGQFDFEQRIAEADKPVVIVFTGVNGVGKTTSIAKLSQYLEQQGYDSVVANGDTFRAGANEQIEEHAENLGIKLIAHEQGGDPAAVIYDGVEYAEANDVDVVLGDTAGRLHTSEGLMDQLEKIDRVVDPDTTLFVDEAVAGQDAVNRAREFHEVAPIDGTVLTKADADAQGGAAISIAHVTGKPILFLGTGQGYDDLERFDPEWLVDQLVGAE